MAHARQPEVVWIQYSSSFKNNKNLFFSGLRLIVKIKCEPFLSGAGIFLLVTLKKITRAYATRHFRCFGHGVREMTDIAATLAAAFDLDLKPQPLQLQLFLLSFYLSKTQYILSCSFEGHLALLFLVWNAILPRQWLLPNESSSMQNSQQKSTRLNQRRLQMDLWEKRFNQHHL